METIYSNETIKFYYVITHIAFAFPRGMLYILQS